MKKIVVFLFFLPCLFSAQKNSGGIDFSVKENSLFLRSIIERNRFFGLENMIKDPGGIIYRFWDSRACIEISNINGIIKGKVILAVKNLNPDNYLRKSYELNSDQVENVFKIIKRYNIDTLPTDSKIEGWVHGFDGNLISIESNKDQHYSYKQYWTPVVQDIPESKIIINMTNDMKEAVALIDLVKQFDSEIQSVCYRYYGAHYSVCNFDHSRKKKLD